MNLKASVIISNYQGRDLLPECLAHLMNQTYQNFEVIFVDAGSTDGSADYVSANFPSVILVRRSRIGIGEAVNAGIDASTGDIIIFDLNTDEFVEPDWLEQIVKQLEKYDFKVITGTTRVVYGTDQIDECGVNLGFFGQAQKRGQAHPIREFFLNDTPALYVGCPAFHRDILKLVGPIDEHYFLYGEDLDFCYRAKLRGIETRPAPLALSHHMIRGTLSKSSRRLEFFLRRAYLKFHISFSSPSRALVNFLYLALFLEPSAMIAAFCPTRKAPAYHEKFIGRTMALMWYARSIRRNLRKRRQLRQMRRATRVLKIGACRMETRIGLD